MDAQRWLELAREKFDEQDYFKARDFLDNALQFDDQSVVARKLRGLTYIHLGEFDLAQQDYQWLLQQDQVDRETHLQYAGLLLVTEQPEQARTEFTTVLEQHPDDADALKGIGDSYFMQNNFLDAQKSYDTALELRPGDAYIWYAKAEAYYRAQDHEEAFRCIEQAIDLAAAPEFFAFKGDFYIRHDNFERALEQYVLAKNLAPEDYEILLRLGFIYRVLDRQKDALGMFEDVLKVNPYSVEALENKVQVLNSLGRKDQAIYTMEQLVRLEPTDERRSLELAQLYLDDEDYVRAEEFFGLTLEHHPEHAEAWYGRAYALNQLDRNEEALEAVQKAMELDPESIQELEQLRSEIEQALDS